MIEISCKIRGGFARGHSLSPCNACLRRPLKWGASGIGCKREVPLTILLFTWATFRSQKRLQLTMFGPGRFGDVILKRRKPHKLSVAKCRRAVVHSTEGKRPRHQPPEMKRPITFYKKYCVYRGRYSKTTLIFNKMGFEGESTANFQTLNPT